MLQINLVWKHSKASKDHHTTPGKRAVVVWQPGSLCYCPWQVTASVKGHKIGIHQPHSSIKFYQFYCFCLAVSEPVIQNYQLKTEVLLAGSSVPMYFQARISVLFYSLATNFISKHGIELAIVYL